MRSNDVRAALAAAHRQPEWAIFFEVANATGANQRRWADAIAINMWPSRGLAIHGFEIKVDRSDWLRELNDPAKAEAIARHCDYWSIVVPKGLISGGIPDSWGLYEVDEAGRLRQKIPPAKRTPVPVDRHFFASLVRSRSKQDESVVDALVAQKLAVARAEDAKSLERRIKERTAEASSVVDARSRFAKAFARYGVLSSLDEDQIVEGLEMLHHLGILKGWGTLRNLFAQVRAATKIIEDAEKMLTKEATDA